jgi:hypothetical protein
MRWSIIFSLVIFVVWFVKWNELNLYRLILHKLIINTHMRNMQLVRLAGG